MLAILMSILIWLLNGRMLYLLCKVNASKRRGRYALILVGTANISLTLFSTVEGYVFSTLSPSNGIIATLKSLTISSYLLNMIANLNLAYNRLLATERPIHFRAKLMRMGIHKRYFIIPIASHGIGFVLGFLGVFYWRSKAVYILVGVCRVLASVAFAVIYCNVFICLRRSRKRLACFRVARNMNPNEEEVGNDKKKQSNKSTSLQGNSSQIRRKNSEYNDDEAYSFNCVVGLNKEKASERKITRKKQRNKISPSCNLPERRMDTEEHNNIIITSPADSNGNKQCIQAQPADNIMESYAICNMETREEDACSWIDVKLHTRRSLSANDEKDSTYNIEDNVSRIDGQSCVESLQIIIKEKKEKCDGNYDQIEGSSRNILSTSIHHKRNEFEMVDITLRSEQLREPSIVSRAPSVASRFSLQSPQHTALKQRQRTGEKYLFKVSKALIASYTILHFPFTILSFVQTEHGIVCDSNNIGCMLSFMLMMLNAVFDPILYMLLETKRLTHL